MTAADLYVVAALLVVLAVVGLATMAVYGVRQLRDR